MTIWSWNWEYELTPEFYVRIYISHSPIKPMWSPACICHWNSCFMIRPPALCRADSGWIKSQLSPINFQKIVSTKVILVKKNNCILCPFVSYYRSPHRPRFLTTLYIYNTSTSHSVGSSIMRSKVCWMSNMRWSMTLMGPTWKFLEPNFRESWTHRMGREVCQWNIFLN